MRHRNAEPPPNSHQLTALAQAMQRPQRMWVFGGFAGDGEKLRGGS